MSSYNYNPIPSRVWSRVQNQCTFTDASGNSDINYQQVYIPLTGQLVPQGQANYEKQMFYKGNILQYKANSAKFTKAQKYSQLAKMCGPNRTKVFATQSETYTNPNTSGLLRVNYNTYSYPNQIVGAPNNISGPFTYNIQNPNDCSGNSIQDGGTLICGTYANPCTGEIIQQGPKTATICNSSSASNVPGYSTLCWNNKIQTFFPKSRYTMNNSTSKWPINYKGFVSSIIPLPPILDMSYNIICNTTYVILTWSVSNSLCMPISSFKIYQNETLVDTVSYQITSYNLMLKNGVNNIYVTSISYNIESLPSNTVIANPVNLFSATGNYNLYCNNGFTGIVFDYQSGSQSLTLNYPQLVTLIVIGGGGGGTNGLYTPILKSGNVGGAGGGITYVQNLYLNSGTYNINVGSGGKGTVYGNNSPGQSGGNSNFENFISYGGNGGGINNYCYSFGGGINTIYGGGGGMGATAIGGSTQIYPNICSGVNSILCNQGSIFNNIYNACNSFYSNNSIPIFVPFISLNSSITVGGGGGGSITFDSNGGGSGKGIGGSLSGSTSINGEDGYNSIYLGYGGGGGGGGLSSFGNGGNGGNGAVIVYWPPYNTSYINTNNFIGNYIIYNNNGYIGYVFNYGSGTITINQNINNINIILCGGGGAGGDGSQNPNVNYGGGGGGGGTSIFQNVSFLVGQQFSVSVGTGGTYSQPNGLNTVFGSDPNYIAYGGQGSPITTCDGGNGGNGNGLGGGGGGGGGGVTNLGNSLGGNGGSGAGIGSPGQGIGNGSNGGNSYIYNNSGGIFLPFLSSQNIVQFGGGGQAAVYDSGNFSNGGSPGLGKGGNNGPNNTFFAGNGINNINSGFGGGGGGSSSIYYGSGGSGGNGVIILWWKI